MPLLILSVIIQIGFAVHAARTGRDGKWLYFILLFPMVGCLAYFFIEVLPSLGESRGARKAGRAVINTLDPNRDLRQSVNNLEVSNNVDNLIEFAEQCMQKQHYQEAVDAYQKALDGFFAKDPKIKLGLAQARFELAEYNQTIQLLDELIADNPDFTSQEGHLLYARALQGDNRTDEALHEFETLAQYYAGPEAKCRYALLLQQLGKTALANSLFQEVKTTAKNSPKHYTVLHKQWVDLARKNT